jgi:ribosome-associated translation inhibitor RaiA
MSNKDQLKTEIEKTFHRLVTDEIKEQVVDFTVMWFNKKKIDIDRNTLFQVLEVVRSAIDDSYYKSIDRCIDSLDKSLQEFVDDTNPLALTK